MQCLHCLQHYQVDEEWNSLGKDPDGTWAVAWTACAACGRLNVFMQRGGYVSTGSGVTWRAFENYAVRPLGITRPPLAEQVPGQYRDLYVEAASVLGLSPRASAALSRRCLQQLIRVELGVTGRDLYSEIETVIANGKVPGYLGEQLHYVRDVGNMAAHPMRNVQTDAIVDVEPGEAEATLDLLDGVFDFVFVEPARVAGRRAALDAKLGR